MKLLSLLSTAAIIWLHLTTPAHAGTVVGTDWTFTYSEPDDNTNNVGPGEYDPLTSMINSINSLQNGERMYITIYSFTGTALTHGAACKLLQAISNKLPLIPLGQIYLILDAGYLNTPGNTQSHVTNYCGYMINTLAANYPNFRYEIRHITPPALPSSYGIMHKKDYLITPINPGVPGSGRSVVKIGTDNKTTGAYNNQHNSGITFKGDFPSSQPSLNSIGDKLALPMQNELAQMMNSPNNPTDGRYHLDPTKNKNLNTYPHDMAVFNNGKCKVGVRFSPNPNNLPPTNPNANNALLHYVNAIKAAQNTIVIAENKLTHAAITAALIEACDNGKKVYIEIDPVDRNPGGASYPQWQYLLNPANYQNGGRSNLHVLCVDDKFGPPYQPFSGPLNFTNIRLHNKITLIDPGQGLPSSMAIIGSTNKTASALTGTGSGHSDETLAFIKCCEVEKAIYEYLNTILYSCGNLQCSDPSCTGQQALPPLSPDACSQCSPRVNSTAVNTTPADFTLWLPLDETSGNTATSLRGNHVATVGNGYSWTSDGLVDGALSLQYTTPTTDPALTIPHSPELQNDHAFVYDAWLYIPNDNFTVTRGVGGVNLWTKIDFPNATGPGLILGLFDFAPFHPLNPNIVGPRTTYLYAGLRDNNSVSELIQSPPLPVNSCTPNFPTKPVGHSGLCHGSWNFIAIRGKRLPDNRMQFTFRVNDWVSPPITSNQSFASFANTQPVRISTEIGRGSRPPAMRIDEIEWFNHGLISDAALHAIYLAGPHGKNKCNPFIPGPTGRSPYEFPPLDLDIPRDLPPIDLPYPPSPRTRRVIPQEEIDKLQQAQLDYIIKTYNNWKNKISQEIKNIQNSIHALSNNVQTLQKQLTPTRDPRTQNRLRQQIQTINRSISDLRILLLDKQQEFRIGQQYYLQSDLPTEKL